MKKLRNFNEKKKLSQFTKFQFFMLRRKKKYQKIEGVIYNKKKHMMETEQKLK